MYNICGWIYIHIVYQRPMQTDNFGLDSMLSSFTPRLPSFALSRKLSSVGAVGWPAKQ